jgi:anti-sigma factor RsiW
MKYSPFISCRQAAWLITAKLDRDLGPLERVALGLHLTICKACPRLIAQLDAMRRATREMRDEIQQSPESS